MKSRHYPAIDGLRGISILCVVLSHAGNGWEHIFPGTLGVMLFFVISGFVITRLLLQEIALKNTIALKKFYLLRVLRLMPALMLYLSIFVPLLLFLGADITSVHVLSGLVYMANYYHIFVGYPEYNPMPILWSLAVEEHFYLLFPLCLSLLHPYPRMLLCLLMVYVITVLVWRYWLYFHCFTDALWICGHKERIRAQGSDAIMDVIVYGIIVALLDRFYPETIQKIARRRLVVCSALLLLIFCVTIRSPAFRETLRYSMEGFASALLLTGIVYGDYFKKILGHPLLVYIGKISYALYLFHFGVLITLEAWTNSPIFDNITIITYILLSFALAIACYHWVERPIQQIRQNYR